MEYSLLSSLELYEPPSTAITTAMDVNPNEANQSNRLLLFLFPRLPPAEKTAAVKVELKWESLPPFGVGFPSESSGVRVREAGRGGQVCLAVLERFSFLVTFATPQLII